ncbi:hypothetical protein M899_2456 [Bacteriovorax sp. BSW11_IV]|nr:hypothetical protein M899_2456 [Bacteriovorax sp. BSW11_IV]
MYAGYMIYIQAWRDSKYDLILDHDGTLFRCSVKTTSTSSVNVTTGTRSGQQIQKDKVKPQLITRKDCDVVIVYSFNTNSTYVVPSSFIQAVKRDNISLNLLEPFKDKWKIFRCKIPNKLAPTQVQMRNLLKSKNIKINYKKKLDGIKFKAGENKKRIHLLHSYYSKQLE